MLRGTRIILMTSKPLSTTDFNRVFPHCMSRHDEWAVRVKKFGNFRVFCNRYYNNCARRLNNVRYVSCSPVAGAVFISTCSQVMFFFCKFPCIFHAVTSRMSESEICYVAITGSENNDPVLPDKEETERSFTRC